MKDNNYLTNHKQPLHELLLEFFKFYSRKGIFLSSGLRCNIRKGRIDLKKKEEEEFLYSIVDPFDHLHNPGSKIHFGLGLSEKILNIIEKTIEDLENGDIKKAFNI